jgi:hypothetical protein
MAFSFGKFLDAATEVASHIVALAASEMKVLHELRADDPLVASAMTLAEADFPGLLLIEGAAQTGLAMAQAGVNAVRAAVIGAGPAAPVLTSAPSTPQTTGIAPVAATT